LQGYFGESIAVRQMQKARDEETGTVIADGGLRPMHNFGRLPFSCGRSAANTKLRLSETAHMLRCAILGLRLPIFAARSGRCMVFHIVPAS